MRPFPGMLNTKFVRENARADNIVIFNFLYCADKGLRRPWGFPVTGGEILVTYLSPYTSCSLYNQSTGIYNVMDILTSTRVLLLVRAASGFTDNF